MLRGKYITGSEDDYGRGGDIAIWPVDEEGRLAKEIVGLDDATT